jgi:hypothetical protein
MRRTGKLLRLGLVTVGALGLRASDAAAQYRPDEKFALGVGAAYVEFDTNAKFTDRNSGLSVFLDAEGSLGLPETDAVGNIYGAFRFSRKHAFNFAHFQVRRNVTIIDETVDIGDYTFSGTASLDDRTRFYSRNYGSTVFADDRASVRTVFGLYGLDLRYRFEAVGEIRIGDEIDATEITEEASVFAPLPLVGFEFWFSFTRKWSLGSRVQAIAGQYDDVSATVFQTSLNARYRFNRRIGGLLGVTYFDADVAISKPDKKTEIAYGYDGLYLGLHFIL